ncbi:Fe/S biogenesis protein nfuA [Candidatus Photodesmus katoptron]|uniref:Fe/S biogenesis protein NfuA n=1 Tax=Candidatus Photodesmus katoptron Akat1 TaxID=1236703 RepID=S3EH71_9GAMM|nr:Fe-S biogenesis protein NfuA [Candidatus Photodesmus katoptron]EPE37538.1 nifU-like protein [Candidatus Photodesmus katoptron Akat1]KEY90188.1 Fe/S biogenesis protein nfuA [Candidatus Photodesmus katoptron]
MLNFISISETAQIYFVSLLNKKEKNTNIRLFVVDPGTEKAECGVSYCPRESVESTDTEFKFNGFSAYVDELSLPFLKHAEIDCITDKISSQLTLKAPNAKKNKISKDATLLERVNYVIQTQLNPHLSDHGGHIKLVEITEDGIAVIEFGGGCNGCSMVNITLKENIEKELLQKFSTELTAVHDITNHNPNDLSYY